MLYSIVGHGCLHRGAYLMTLLGTLCPACDMGHGLPHREAYRHGKCRGAYLHHGAYLHRGAEHHRGDMVVSITELTVIVELTAMDT